MQSDLSQELPSSHPRPLLFQELAAPSHQESVTRQEGSEMLLWEGNLHNSPALLLPPHPSFISLQSTTSSFRTNKYIFKTAGALCPHPVALTCCAVNFADRSSFPQGRCNIHSQNLFCFFAGLVAAWTKLLQNLGPLSKSGVGERQGSFAGAKAQQNILPCVSLDGAWDLSMLGLLCFKEMCQLLTIPPPAAPTGTCGQSHTSCLQFCQEN